VVHVREGDNSVHPLLASFSIYSTEQVVSAMLGQPLATPVSATSRPASLSLSAADYSESSEPGNEPTPAAPPLQRFELLSLPKDICAAPSLLCGYVCSYILYSLSLRSMQKVVQASL
jgi:hypothetical protein